MFLKTILSILAFGTVIVGLLQFFNSGEYLTFAIGMALYYLVSVSGTFFKQTHE